MSMMPMSMPMRQDGHCVHVRREYARPRLTNAPCSRGSAVQGQAGKSSVHVASTLLLLSCVNGLALVLKNLGFVVSFGGALLGSALVYIFPALMFVRATQQKAASLKAQGKGAEPRAHEAPFAQSISTCPSARAALGVHRSRSRSACAMPCAGKELPAGRKTEMWANVGLAILGAYLSFVGCQQSLKGAGH